MSSILTFTLTTPDAFPMASVAPELALGLQRSVERRTVSLGAANTTVTSVVTEESVTVVEVDDATATAAQVLTFSMATTPGAEGAFILTSSLDGPFAGTPADENGEGAVAWGALSVGSHSITATYFGDGTVASSTSAAITVVVSP